MTKHEKDSMAAFEAALRRLEHAKAPESLAESVAERLADLPAPKARVARPKAQQAPRCERGLWMLLAFAGFGLATLAFVGMDMEGLTNMLLGSIGGADRGLVGGRMFALASASGQGVVVASFGFALAYLAALWKLVHTGRG